MRLGRAKKRHHRALHTVDATAMAVGGMIGGGIFSVLGVAIDHAGHLAVMCFVLGGVLAMLTVRSYVALVHTHEGAGGPYDYLRAAGFPKVANVAAWLLVFGYVLAMGVYGFTFGRYAANLVGGGLVTARVASLVMIGGFLLVNLAGVTLSVLSEDAIVGGKLVVLAGIAIAGIARFDHSRLTPLTNRGGWWGVVLGASAIFIAYEGFELLTFDADDMVEPKRTMPRAMYASVAVVGTIYCSVALGAQMLLSDRKIIASREVAFAAAGEVAFGGFGRVFAALGALLATSSAVHATLFATARFSREMASGGAMPQWVGRTRADGIPANALVALAVAGLAAAMAPSLDDVLVFASASFLGVFLLVNLLAARDRRILPTAAVASLGCLGAIAVLFVGLVT